jgi:hypothetical protein
MLSALPSMRIHRMEVHLRRVHYARWVERNAVVAHATDDSASTRVRYDSKPAVVVLIEPKDEPNPAQEVALEPSVPLNRLLRHFKLGLRSSSDSDPLL